MHLSYSLDFTASNLQLFHHESVGLDVNEVYFDEEQDIPNTRDKSRKFQSITE